MDTGLTASRTERDWFIVGRWEEFEGEGRANLLRPIAVAAFYTVESLNYYGFDLSDLALPAQLSREFHLAITLLTVAWTMLCLGVLLCRLNKVFPAWLKYLSTGGDIVLLTTILMLGSGPKSPMIVGYFLIIALASLRFSLPLVWFASGGSIAGYLYLLGFAKWGWIEGWEKPDQIVPRFHQLIVLVALVMTGVVLGQVIRRVRGLAEHYARRVEAAREVTP